jgi:hypothetical protein
MASLGKNVWHIQALKYVRVKNLTVLELENGCDTVNWSR